MEPMPPWPTSRSSRYLPPIVRSDIEAASVQARVSHGNGVQGGARAGRRGRQCRRWSRWAARGSLRGCRGRRAAAAPSDDPLARAASGDLDALKQLEAQGERRRSAEQALAIARGHAVLARRDLEALARSIADDPALAHDRSTLARLHDFIEREPVALDALVAVSRLPGPESADLLHSVWRRHHQTTVGLLARDLLRGEAARAQNLEEVLTKDEILEQYANRVSYQVLNQHSPRLTRGLPEREDSLEEAYWDR